MADQKVELLRRVPLLADLNTRDLQEVAMLAEEVDVPAGQVLTREGASGSEFFVIVDGQVRIDKGGQTIRTLGPPEFLGEIALLDDSPRTATATTETPAKLIVLGRQQFRSLMTTQPTIANCVVDALLSRVKDNDPNACD